MSQEFVYYKPLIPSYGSSPNQNSNNEERSSTQVNEKENEDEEKEEVAENLHENGENLVTSQILDMPNTQDQIQDENSNKEERCSTQVNEKENEDEEKEEVAENLHENGENLVTSQILDMPTTQDQIQDEDIKFFSGSKTSSEKTGKKLAEDIKFFSGSKTSSEKTGKKLAEVLKFLSYFSISSKDTEKPAERHKSTEASEGSTNRPIHPVDRHTTYNSQEDNRIGMRGSMVNENGCKVQDKQMPSSEANTDASSDESLSTFESTLIRLYENIIRNETSRMMSSIDMVGFEAEHLFGLERSRIFFDLLDEELCHFGSAGAISVPNMAESTVSQHVISFFEHAYDIISRLMTLLSCPDSKILQQMPVQNFISLMKSVIKSSLKAQTKGREKLSLEGNIYTMVDPKDFERALREEIPEYVLNRLRNKDEMVVHRFVDTRLERHQPSDREENRPIYSIYFPSDCRLFIYIPTAYGSYWHYLDMRRADRIRQHG